MGTFYNDFHTPEEMERMHTLECKGLAHYGTLALRACGVPCATIETHWRFTEIIHTSIYIPRTGSNERACRLSIYDNLQDMGEPKDSMASWRSWIYCYEPNPDLIDLSKDRNMPTDFVQPLTRLDVTKEFSNTHSFSLPIPDNMKSKKHLFLCRFHEWKWYPIREGKVNGDSVNFKDATIRQWYRVGFIDADSVQTFGGTFTLNGKGERIDYDCTGDTVLFKMVYNCDSTETRLTRKVTTYHWNTKNEWEPITKDAVLWGLNAKTGEYKIFAENMRGDFKPVFHLLKVHLPCMTVFTDNETPRPLGFIAKDEQTNEGYFMQF